MKITKYVVSSGLAIMALTSCNKNKPKDIVGDYNVTKYTETSEAIGPDSSEVNMSVSATMYMISITDEIESSFSQPSTLQGGVTDHTITINEDGTWSRKFHIDVEGTDYFGYDLELEREITFSGVWNFVGKSNDYKTNDRIIFHITSFAGIETGYHYDWWVWDMVYFNNEVSQTFDDKTWSEIYVIESIGENNIVLTVDGLHHQSQIQTGTGTTFDWAEVTTTSKSLELTRK